MVARSFVRIIWLINERDAYTNLSRRLARKSDVFSSNTFCKSASFKCRLYPTLNNGESHLRKHVN